LPYRKTTLQNRKATSRFTVESMTSFSKVSPFVQSFIQSPKNHSIQYLCLFNLKPYAMKQKQISKDHGKDLYNTIIFLLLLVAALWYLKL
jgi:hypothetical protein